MTLIRLLARPMLASMFVTGGVNALRNTTAMAERAKPVTDEITELSHKFAPSLPIPSDPKTLVRINAGIHIGAGFALATGRAPRLSALVLAVTLVPTTAAGHKFWAETDKSARAAQKTHFFKNVSMFGGLLIAAVDTEGKPGVAWRARHAVGSTKREVKHLHKSARREARLAAKSIRS
jgi:putative oxidoreductase